MLLAVAVACSTTPEVSSAAETDSNDFPFAFADSGQWGPVIDWPMIPIHMALTPDGNVMTYGTEAGGTYQAGDQAFDVWIPELGTGSASHSVMPNGTGTDLFCSIQVIDPIADVILTAGGDIPGDDQAGTNEVTTYSTDGGLQAGPGMQWDRWYPTANTLPDGRILVEGGSTNGFDDGGVLTPEIYTSGQGWTTLSGINSDYAYGDDQKRWWYPRSWVAPDGRVFGISGTNMYYIDVDGSGGSGSLTEAGTFPGTNISATSTAVMYRPGKILQVGGGAISNEDWDNDGSATATIVDINSGDPVLTPASSLAIGRHWANSTVLPDGDVLVTGGTTVQNIAGDSDQVDQRPELWDPDTDTWTTLPAEQEYRMYHSTAMLLPDATVIVGGGGADGNRDDGIDNLNAQIFKPPYLYDGDVLAARPLIIDAPEFISYGQDFNITVTSDVQKITLIRIGAVTHSFNSGQRFMELTDLTGSGTNRTVTAPADGNLAPPGTYMLFGLNAAGTPSVAALVDINPAGTDPEPPPATLTDSEFVAASYTDVLGRAATSSERSVGLATIASAGRAELVEDLLLLDTAEGHSRAAIGRLYRAFFQREPDLGGFDYWYSQSVVLGYDPNPISFSFSVQPEFQNRYGDLSNSEFLNLVYANVLGRSPEAAGRAYWMDMMDSGELNRGQVMIWFSEGQENKNNVDGRILTVNAYKAVHHRMPTTSEIANWEHVLNPTAGTPPGSPEATSNLIDQLLASAEYEARISG